MAEHLIIIEPDARVTFIYSDDLAPLLSCGQTDVRRASNCEPAPNGGWTADLSPSGGPVLGPFPLRGQALEAEVKWLEDRMSQ